MQMIYFPQRRIFCSLIGEVVGDVATHPMKENNMKHVVLNKALIETLNLGDEEIEHVELFLSEARKDDKQRHFSTTIHVDIVTERVVGKATPIKLVTSNQNIHIKFGKLGKTPALVGFVYLLLASFLEDKAVSGHQTLTLPALEDDQKDMHLMVSAAVESECFVFVVAPA